MKNCSLVVKVLLGLILLSAFYHRASSQTIHGSQVTTTATQPTTFEAVADFISKHGKLPPNYITKKEAQALGWNPRSGNLWQVAPGKSIGGDVFGNFEGRLPKAKGRVWREADINYRGGRRGADRLLYANDGLMYKTTDHYQTFTRMR